MSAVLTMAVDALKLTLAEAAALQAACRRPLGRFHRGWSAETFIVTQATAERLRAKRLVTIGEIVAPTEAGRRACREYFG